jgi:hypothetical protein
MSRVENLFGRVEDTAQGLRRGISDTVKGAEDWLDREADRAWERYKPNAERTVDEVVQKQIKKYTPWIVLLYVLLGLAVLFSVLTFVRVHQHRRCFY